MIKVHSWLLDDVLLDLAHIVKIDLCFNSQASSLQLCAMGEKFALQKAPILKVLCAQLFHPQWSLFKNFASIRLFFNLFSYLYPCPSRRRRGTPVSIRVSRIPRYNFNHFQFTCHESHPWDWGLKNPNFGFNQGCSPAGVLSDVSEMLITFCNRLYYFITL